MTDGEAEVTTLVDACSAEEYGTEYGRWWTERMLMPGGARYLRWTPFDVWPMMKPEAARWTKPEETVGLLVWPWDRHGRRQEADVRIMGNENEETEIANPKKALSEPAVGEHARRAYLKQSVFDAVGLTELCPGWQSSATADPSTRPFRQCRARMEGSAQDEQWLDAAGVASSSCGVPKGRCSSGAAVRGDAQDVAIPSGSDSTRIRKEHSEREQAKRRCIEKPDTGWRL